MNEKSLEDVLCDVRSMAPYVMCSREEMKDRTSTFEISRFECDDDHDETDDSRGSSSLQRMVQKTKHRPSKKADARRVVSGYLLCDDDVGKDSLEWKLHNQQLSACLSLFRISLDVLASNNNEDIVADAILLQEIDESLSFSLLHSICSAGSLHNFGDYNSPFLHSTLDLREIVQLVSSLLPRSLAKCNYDTTRVSLSGTVLDLFPKVKRAIRLIVLIQDRNYVRIIQVLTEGNERWNVVLRAIVAPKVLPLLRFSALEIWNCSMMKRGKYPLNEVRIKI